MDRLARKKEKFTVRTLKAYLMAEKARKAGVVKQDLSSLKVADLKAIASSHGITIHVGSRKADIIAAIEHAGRYMRRDMRAV